MLSQAIEDYLKVIYKLQAEGGVTTTKISKLMNVSGASVTGMIKRLSMMSIVEYNSYKGVKLTPKGEKIALEIIRHHRLLELYLKEVLEFPLDKVHDEACRLEHSISDEFADKISNLMGDPKYDPHGHPIPTKDGKMPELNEKCLVEIDEGKEAKIVRLIDNDPKLLKYLESLELVPGNSISISEKAPFNGPLTIKVNSQEKIIGMEVAKKIFVSIADKKKKKRS